jgi:putative Holliday junction resolvase
MKTGRRIAFDYGQVRIGVAASDISGLIASPIDTLSAIDPELFLRIANLIAEYDPIYLVVGEPRHLSGQSSASQTAAYEFAEKLKTITDIPIHFIDERLSTISAARNLRNSGHNSKSSKSRIDAMAAVSILESALNKERIAGHLE